MKILSFILGFYVLALGCITCTDDNFTEVRDGQSEIVATHATEHGHLPFGDECSPFCACACCQVNTVTPLPMPQLQNPFKASNSPVVFIQSHHDDIPHPLWKPPKIA